MKIVVINDIHVGKDLMHNGIIRAPSHLIEEKLEDSLRRIIENHAPDLLVNLGDLIRSENREKDLKSYSKLLSYFNQLQSPVLHLLGNHELKTMSEKELENVWLKEGLQQESFGSKKMGGFNFIWLGLELNPNDQAICVLPTKQLNWLKDELQKIDLPTLIFSHCPLDDQDLTGNFFYEAKDNRSKKALFLENQESVRDIVAAFPHVKAVIQAHLHYFNVKLIYTVPYITCPAMADHICCPNVSGNIPEIYTIINIDKQRLSVKAFSNDYCFAGYEGIYT